MADDKNGNILNVGDLVWFEVFETKLFHTGIKRMLGRIVYIDNSSYLSIILGEEKLALRRRPSFDVEIASENDAENLFHQQINEYQNYLMLFMLENAV